MRALHGLTALMPKSAPAPLTTSLSANELSGIWGQQGPVSPGNPCRAETMSSEGASMGPGPAGTVLQGVEAR